jgi:hypothetical protein
MITTCQPHSRFHAGGFAIARLGEICVRFEGMNVLIRPTSSHRRATVWDRRTSAFPESPMLASEAAGPAVLPMLPGASFEAAACRKARTRCRTPRSPSYASTPPAQSRRWSFRPYGPAPPGGLRQAARVPVPSGRGIGNNPEAKPRMIWVRVEISWPSAGDRRVPAKGSRRLGQGSATATPA